MAFDIISPILTPTIYQPATTNNSKNLTHQDYFHLDLFRGTYLQSLYNLDLDYHPHLNQY